MFNCVSFRSDSVVGFFSASYFITCKIHTCMHLLRYIRINKYTAFLTWYTFVAYFVFKVLFPISSPMIGFQGDMTYCQLSDDLVSHSNNDGPSRCTYQCPCVGPHCSEVLVFFATAYSNIEWNLCELLANNI